MRLSELLESAAAHLPKGPRKGPFRTALESAFGGYLAGVGDLDALDFASAKVRDQRELVREVAEGVLAVHEHSIRGQPSHARRILDQTLEKAAEQINALISIDLKPEDNRYMFRMRRGPSTPPLSRRDLFHIPFELRHKVGPQRYSVPGLPMLYIGSSLLVCWYEMGAPPLSETWICRLEPLDDLRVLNFGYRPSLVGLWLANHRDPERSPLAEFAANYAIVWPLVAACSFRASHRGSAFVEEYIVPQLLTGWLSEQESGGIDGIRYFSTHLEHAHAELCMNYVFTPREVTEKGHCPMLASRFKLTDPLLWEYAKQVRSPTMRSSQEGRGAWLDNGEAQGVDYSHTNWGAMESQLRHMKKEPIC